MMQTLFSELLERQYGHLCTWDLHYMKKIVLPPLLTMNDPMETGPGADFQLVK